MELDRNIDITAKQRKTVLALLERHLPNTAAWVYGSRAKWTSRPQSDLDIVVFATPEQAGRVSDLREAFEESNLPFRVDLFVWDAVPEQFRKQIKRDHVVLARGDGRNFGQKSSEVVGEWRETLYGRVAANYIEEPLKNLCIPEHGIQTGPFGSQLHKRDYVTNGTPIVTVEHLDENRIIHQDLPRVSDRDRKRLSKYSLHEGDIVFSRVGSVDRRSLVRKEEDGWLFSGRCLRVRVDSNKIDPVFLSYFFGLKSFREHINSIAVGATMPSLNTQLLSDVLIPHPTLPKQRAIAHILGTLDDKIELNRRMNETLDAMARALFKSWFVDFDPVRAKMKGRDPGLPPHLADLFPDRLVNSELGEIPEGWEVTSLSECVDVMRGLSYKGSYLSSDGVPMHNLNSIYEGGGYKHDGLKGYDGEHKQQHVARAGDVIVANTEQGHDRLLIGYAAIIPTYFVNETLFSHHIYRVRPRESTALTSNYLCQLLNTKIMHEIVSGFANGTTVNMLPMDALQTPQIAVPARPILAAFNDLAESARRRQEEMIDESRTLDALRDTLLPKLISGETRVRDADKQEGAIV